MIEANKDLYYRDPPLPVARHKLVPILSVLESVKEQDENLTADEIADALTRVADGDYMIYDGESDGLCTPKDGNPDVEHDGWNKRTDLFTEFFNQKYWRDDRAPYSFLKLSSLMLLREDAEKLANALWVFFNSDNVCEKKDFRFSVDATAKTNPPYVITAKEVSSRDSSSTINGATFAKLQRAIAAFPSRYPDHATRLPKLDADLRPWLKEAGMATNDREAHVFGAILLEHFELSPDPQKSQ
jgi:hypothetical protein